jgi:hypothetical protein
MGVPGAALGEAADGLQFRFSCVALLGDEDIRSAFLERLPMRYFVTTEGFGHPHHASPLAICARSQSSFRSRPRPGPSGTGDTLFRTTGSGPYAIFSLLPRKAPRAFSTLKKF